MKWKEIVYIQAITTPLSFHDYTELRQDYAPFSLKDQPPSPEMNILSKHCQINFS